MNPIDNNIGTRPTRSEPEQGSPRSEQVRSGDAARSAELGNAAPSASVFLTRTAEELSSLENQLRELPGFDRERVDSIRAAIDSGQYEVNAAQVVEGLLQSERELV